MSVQMNQYLMYGISVPFEWHNEWELNNGKDFYDTFQNFIEDSAYDTKINHVDGLFCLFDGMNGSYIVIGHVLAKSCDDEPFLADGQPMKINMLKDTEKLQIECKVLEYFGLKGDFDYYITTKYS